MSRTILIFTSKTGGGHISLAEALRDALTLEHGDDKIEIIDPQPGFIHWHYRMVSRYALWLWAAEYRLMDTAAGARMAHRFFARGVSGPIRQTIERVEPDLIISTYPFLTYEVMGVLNTYSRSIPFAMLFTDPNGVHASWLTEQRGSATLAPTTETYEQALKAGFPPDRLHQVGWPVRQQFYQVDTQARPDFLQNLGLHPERFTVFLQGGGEGAAQFVSTVERVLAIQPRVQIILATGTNTALYTRFQATPRIHALPFTHTIAPYMAASDVIMGKAGPNMLFEAVTLGKPFIATAYIPGQEEVNLEFIQRHQLGWVALTAYEQVSLLERLAQHPAERQSMDASVARYRQWNQQHTALILPVLERLLQNGPS